MMEARPNTQLDFSKGRTQVAQGTFYSVTGQVGKGPETGVTTLTLDIQLNTPFIKETYATSFWVENNVISAWQPFQNSEVVVLKAPETSDQERALIRVYTPIKIVARFDEETYKCNPDSIDLIKIGYKGNSVNLSLKDMPLPREIIRAATEEFKFSANIR